MQRLPSRHTPPQELYAAARQLASVVVPNEYGVGPDQKLRIGSKIAAELVAKLLTDLASMQVWGGERASPDHAPRASGRAHPHTLVQAPTLGPTWLSSRGTPQPSSRPHAPPLPPPGAQEESIATAAMEKDMSAARGSGGRSSVAA